MKNSNDDVRQVRRKETEGGGKGRDVLTSEDATGSKVGIGKKKALPEKRGRMSRGEGGYIFQPMIQGLRQRQEEVTSLNPPNDSYEKEKGRKRSFRRRSALHQRKRGRGTSAQRGERDQES